MVRWGTAKGEKHGMAVLDERQIRDIRELIDNGYTQKHVAGSYGISTSQVNSIYKRRTWKHV